MSLQTLTRRDIEFHLSEGRALPVRQLKNGTRIRTRVGSLSVLGVPDMLNAAALVRLTVSAPHGGPQGGPGGPRRRRQAAFGITHCSRALSHQHVCFSSSQASFYINHRFIVDADVLASNGIIHVLEGPLEAPPPHTEVGDVTFCVCPFPLSPVTWLVIGPDARGPQGWDGGRRGSAHHGPGWSHLCGLSLLLPDRQTIPLPLFQGQTHI